MRQPPRRRTAMSAALAVLLAALLVVTMAPTPSALAEPGAGTTAARSAEPAEQPPSGRPEGQDGRLDVTDNLGKIVRRAPSPKSVLGPAAPPADGEQAGSGDGEDLRTATLEEPRRGVEHAVRAELAGKDRADGTPAGDGEVRVVIRLRDQANLPALRERAESAGLQAGARVRAKRSRAGAADPSAVRAAASDAAKKARVATVVDRLTSLADAQNDAVAGLLHRERTAGHASEVREYWIFNGFAATVDKTALETLAAHPDVASVTLDQTHRLPEPEAGEVRLPGWDLEKVGAPHVWGGYGDRGEGVVVGVMDSGVDGGHPALASRYRGANGDGDRSWFVPTGENYPEPGDGFGHGTHVTGSILGGAPGEIVGVAPRAQWIAAKVFTDSGGTSDSILHSGFQWMLAPGGDPGAAPDVVNNSWGSDAGDDTTFAPDVSAWVAAGIVPMFANGNAGPGAGTVGSPASFPDAIGVGATDVNDLIAAFSSRGPAFWDGERYLKPQLSAPGVDIRSAWPRQLPEGPYFTISGTSMATPHATGVVALLLSAAPGLTVDEVRDILVDTARTEAHMGEVPNDNYGHGIVDAYAAVTRAAHSGLLVGTVTGPDGPVAATVSSGDARTTADPETGRYELPLREGDRQVTVTAYGYRTQAFTAAVARGGTTTRDVALQVAPVYTVSGTVTADGTGDPVAKARVRVEATPVDAVTTGADGRWSLDVAAGTYTLRVSAAAFQPATVDLVVDGPVVRDLALQALDTAGEPQWAEYQNNPERTGFSTEPVAGDTFRREWTKDLGADVVFSSPVSADGRTFIGTDDGRLVALDSATGDTLWTHRAGGARRGAPAVAGDVVVAGGGLDGGIHALDTETGEELWTHPTPGLLTVYTTPTVVDGTVYATTGPTDGAADQVLALDLQTGDVKWSHPVGPQVFWGGTVADGLVYAASAATGQLVALDAATGQPRWTLEREDDTFLAAVSEADGVLYATTSGDDGSSGSVLAIDADTGVVSWENDAAGDGQANTPAVYGDVVVAGSHTLGLVRAYDRDTGEVVWTHARSGAVSTSQLTSTDGYVVGGSQLDDKVWALDAATGKQVWEDQLTDNVTSSPAFADGHMVVADASGTVAGFEVTGSVTGTVTGPDGPVAAAVQMVETGAKTTTDPDTGAYQLVHEPGTWTLRFSAYGLAQQERQVTLAAGDELTVDAELAPVGDGALTGTVTDAAGAPLQGAVVELAGTPLDPVRTAADGTFAFTAVAAGTYRLGVTLDGYVPLEQPVTVPDGGAEDVTLALERYDVGVIGDWNGRIAEVLAGLGYQVDGDVDYADVTANPDAFDVVVANGAGGEQPGEAEFTAFLDASDAAGTSVVFLDQWGVTWGAIENLVDYTGDPHALPDDIGGSGPVDLVARVDHPLAAALTSGERTGLLAPGTAWAAYQGYSGRTVADLYTGADGVVGGGVGYAPRGMGSAHVLLPSLGAASWDDPRTDWLPAAAQVLADAVDYAGDVAYGAVSGTVTAAGGDDAGTGLRADVEVLGTGITTSTAADGTYRLLLDPGEYTLRFSRVGSVPVERDVTVAAGAVQTVDVALADSGLGAVSGTVTSGAGGPPLPGATVALLGADVPGTTTDADGAYEIADVPAGEYELEVSATGHRSANVPVTVAEGETTQADFALEVSPLVGVVGDDSDGHIVALLTGAEIEAEPLDWDDVDRVGEFDVVVFNDPSDPGRDTFLEWIDALDAHQVSGVFTADYWSFVGSEPLLREYTGNPASEPTSISGEGDIRFTPVGEDNPLFRGIDGDALLFHSDRRTAAIEDYRGFPLAHVATETGGDRGVGAAYEPRTEGSVHLLLSGLASSLFQDVEEDWTEQAKQVYANAIRWAASPGVGAVSGTVTGSGAEPVAAHVEVLGSPMRTTADADGHYSVALPPGEWMLRFTAFGYTPIEQTVTVGSGRTTSLDVSTSPGDVGSVAGTVTSSGEVGTGGNGVAAGGEPVEGATVRLLGTPRGTTTGADGTYRLRYVEPGDYRLEVSADGHVRQRLPVTVSVDEQAGVDVSLRPSPLVGIIDDAEGYAEGYLRYWGYDTTLLDWTDPAKVAQLDLVLGNFASFDRDPSEQQWRAMADAVNRFGVPVIWLDQFGRGSFGVLADYEGDPASDGQGRDDGPVTVDVTDPDHPLVAGLPEQFQLVEDDSEYSWYEGFSGQTVATVTTEAVTGGGLVGYTGRGAGGVDILLGGLSMSFYGNPAYGDVEANNWTPEAERLLRNALGYALDAPPLAGEVRGSVVNEGGDPLAGSVTVVETGEQFPVRDGDGTFVVPLQPGSWTLRVEVFGYQTKELTADVAAGDVLTPRVVMPAGPAGTVTGTVTDPGGAGVADATVRIVSTPLSAQTGADGTYTITGVPAGDWTVRFQAPGFGVVERPVTVEDGETVTVDASLAVSRRVAVVDDYHDGIAGLLTGEGYEVQDWTRGDLAGLAGQVDEYALVVFNDSVFSSQLDAFGQVLDAAAAARVSVLLTGQWGGDSIGSLQDLRGDPAQVDYSFEDGGIAYTPSAAHPIFAGFEVGQPVEILRDPDGNSQQWLSFGGYSGTTVADVTHVEEGTDLGGGVGYRFTSAASVEVLLASLNAGVYGAPGEGWTDDAKQIYLNAVGWAIDATQGAVTGTVTGAGEPVGGATVTALDDGSSTTTAADGTYRLGLPDGEHTIRFEAAGFEPAERTVTVTGSVDALLDVDLQPVPRGSLAGMVTDAGGSPVAGASVTVTGPQDASATTGADGRYEIGDLVEGSYDVTVSAGGFLPATGQVEVTADSAATFDAALSRLDVGVLGDVDDAVTSFLRDEGVAAAELDWADFADDADDTGDLDGYQAVVVNGDDPDLAGGGVDEAAFDALLAEADAEQVNLVFGGTWGVDQGGVRLLEAYTDDVEVVDQGYGEGPVSVTGLDADHPLFAGIDDPAEIIGAGGYYSVLGDYAGEPLAQVSVAAPDGDGTVASGLGVGAGWRTADSLEVVLSASAVTSAVGPDRGWTDDGERLLLNAVEWARDVPPLAPPRPPTLQASSVLVAADTVEVSGTAEGRSTVTVLRDGAELASVPAGDDGSWSADVPLVEGPNVLTAVASNLAGGSPPSRPVTVVRDTTGPQVYWAGPADGTGHLDPEVTVSGAVRDPYAGVAELRIGDRAVPVAGDGSFAATVELAEGVNELVLTAADALGNTTELTRELLYVAWEPHWKVTGRNHHGATKVRLGFRTDHGRLARADEAMLVVTDSGGDEALRKEMTWHHKRYRATIRGLDRGRYTLSAAVAEVGFTITVAGPPLHLR